MNMHEPENKKILLGEESSEVILVEEGLKRVMNNKNLFTRLLNNFKGRSMVNDIVQAVEKNDPEEISKAVHTLKGVAANLAMHLLAATLEQMELKLKAGENIDDLIPVLQDRLEEVEEAITKMNEVK